MCIIFSKNSKQNTASECIWRRLSDKIKTDFREIACEDEEWIKRTQNMVQRKIFMMTWWNFGSVKTGFFIYRPAKKDHVPWCWWNLVYPVCNKKFFERTFFSLHIEYLTRHGPRRIHRVQQFFYCCVCSLPRERVCLPSRCVATIRGIHREQDDLISLFYFVQFYFQNKESRQKIRLSVCFIFPAVDIIGTTQ
jgi:hypothetical protein